MVCLHTLTQRCEKLYQDLLLTTNKSSVSNSRYVVSLTQCTDCLVTDTFAGTRGYILPFQMHHQRYQIELCSSRFDNIAS